MRIEQTEIPGVLVVEPVVHGDARGFFVETWHAARYAEAGIPKGFVQDNHSRSRRGVLRGLHGQRVHAQGKLVRCVEGAVFDVAVDVRRGSPSFGRWVGRELRADNFLQLWVPAGLLHGFVALSEHAQIEYKCTALYAASDEWGLRWDDPDLAIAWPIREPLVSAKDAALPRLSDAPVLPVYEAAP